MGAKLGSKNALGNKGNTLPKSRYLPEYCVQMLQFFDKPLTIKTKKKVLTRSGEVEEIIEEQPEIIPFLSAFARKIDVATETLENWRDEYPEFGYVYKKCKEIQKEFIIQNATAGRYNPTFTIFAAKNITDMRDVSTIDMVQVKSDLTNLAGKMCEVARKYIAKSAYIDYLNDIDKLIKESNETEN